MVGSAFIIGFQLAGIIISGSHKVYLAGAFIS